jgi:ATP-dependent DNA helicase DinG
MSNSKWQRLLGAALVALLLTTSLTPVAMAATPAAVAQQVTEATELTALLPGGEFYKVWLALTPDGPNVNVTVTAEWDRDNALETGVGFYVLDENNLAAVVNGEPLPANNVGIGSSNFFLNGSSNMQGTSFSATGTSYTVVLFNDSNSDANVTLRVTNATISDDSGQVSAPGATDDATADATATMTDTATTTDTTTVATTDTVTDTATDTTDTAADATDTVTDTAATTETVAATPAATEAAATTAAAVPAGPVRAETMEGELPEQYNQHFLALEPSVRDGDITLVLTYDPQDSTELARRINFWVLDDAGFRRYQDGESASAVAIAAGSQSFIEPDTSNKREASFQATGFGPYTVIVQNNSRVPATYQLAVTGGVLVDDSAQTLTAQQAGGVTATGTTTGTVATTATTTTTAAADATTATTTTATTTAGTGVAGTPGGTYTVQSGDTLAIIARDIYGDYRLYEQLCAFNNIADCNVIEVGQVINLPTEAEIGAVAAPAAAATSTTCVRDVPGTAHRDAGRGSGLAPCRGRGDLCARKRQPRSRHAPARTRSHTNLLGRAGNVAHTRHTPTGYGSEFLARVCATSPARRTGMRAGEAVLRRAGVGATFARENGSRDPGTPPHAPGRTRTCWGEPGTSRTLATPQKGMVQNFWCVCARRPRLGAQGCGQGKRSCAVPGSGRPLRAKTAAAIPARPRTHPVAHEPAGACRERRAHSPHPKRVWFRIFGACVRDVPGSAHRDAGRGSGLAPCRGRGDLCARKRQPRSRHAPARTRSHTNLLGRAGNVAHTRHTPKGMVQNFWCVCATSPARRTGMRAGEAVLRRAGVGATFSRENGSRDPGTPPHAPGRTRTCWGVPGTSRTPAGASYPTIADEFADSASHKREKTPLTEAMPALAAFDAAAFFGPDGPLARELYGYEQRPSQVQMAAAVQQAILEHKHALIEAPTGTGKSIAYLAPAILSGKTVVVSTANKSLQSQLLQKDIPFLRQVLGRDIRAVIVKGRSNYVCTYKWEKELAEQKYISLYDREDDQVKFLRGWLTQTETGDVDDLPFMLNSDLRPRLVSFPDDCLHGDCRHYEDNCWVNHMRDAAAEAQVLITNHHLLLNALELGFAGERILPPASLYVVDEAHHLEQIATAVYETVVTDYTVEQLLARATLKEHMPEEEIERLRYLNTLAFQEISNQSRDNAFQLQNELESLQQLGSALSKLGQQLRQNNPYAKEVEQAAQRGERPPEEVAEKNRHYELTIETVNSTATKLSTVATNRFDESSVRYAVRLFDRRHISLEVHAAPINPAALLNQFLFHPQNDKDDPLDRTVICTSATLATNGRFEHFKARCGITETGMERVLPSVFNYGEQALLYQPPLPAYDYKSADAYYNAVAAEIERLLEVSRGRTLCLFTNWSGLQQVNDRLQASTGAVIWPVRAQGDAPRDTLLAWFKETPHSVLLATRSFWEGVDIPGEELSLVVLDKMPFPTPGDPLHGARMKAIEQDGRSSFDEYMAPLMTLALKQGFGRLIRRGSDRGVVAILDERLSSKGYGRRARQDLPAARYSRDFRDVHRFFQVESEHRAEFALNVWAKQNEARSSEVGWRWQLVRLQDGRADNAAGNLPTTDPLAGELHAIQQGLADLRRRIEGAGQSATRFSVEIRCSAAIAARLAGAKEHSDGATPAANTSAANEPAANELETAAWRAEEERWKSLAFAPVRH